MRDRHWHPRVVGDSTPGTCPALAWDATGNICTFFPLGTCIPWLLLNPWLGSQEGSAGTQWEWVPCRGGISPPHRIDGTAVQGRTTPSHHLCALNPECGSAAGAAQRSHRARPVLSAGSSPGAAWPPNPSVPAGPAGSSLLGAVCECMTRAGSAELGERELGLLAASM